MKLEDDHYCFACGSLNDIGLKLKFDLDRQKRSISTEFMPLKMHQGFKNIVHGGIIGLILDECMVSLAWKLDIHALSAEYTVRLIKPASINKKLTFSAKMISEKGKLIIIESLCRNGEGKNIASASSKCVKL